MNFSSVLRKGILIKRYKRFLADIKVNNFKNAVTIYCPNTGSMLSCSEPGSNVWYSKSSKKNRKYNHTWELYEKDHFVDVNASRANSIVKEAILKQKIDSFREFKYLNTEVKLDSGSRIDFALEMKKSEFFYIEVKSVTYCLGNKGYFPDSITLRGQKHLEELINLRKKNKKCILFFCAMNSKIESVQPCSVIDHSYNYLCKKAKSEGVQFLAYKTVINTKEVYLDKEIPVHI